MLALIGEAPTIEAELVKHGKWECVNHEYNVYECAGKNGCGHRVLLIDGTPKYNNFNYCPNCGAKMEEKYEY